MWIDLGRALCLVLVIEGLLLFAAPARWRPMLLRIASLDDREMRTAGLLGIIVGLIFLQLVQYFS